MNIKRLAVESVSVKPDYRHSVFVDLEGVDAAALVNGLEPTDEWELIQAIGREKFLECFDLEVNE